jgi:translation initiation factor eIF-2B subunit gamma
MPHASLPNPGFQAFILCGPGISLDTFTTDPSTFPKAIIPIANRPMVWYPLDWCYRTGISDIYLVAPPESKVALETALSQNPYLTSLPSPRPTVVAPDELTDTSGTADIFRQPEVKSIITGDFVVLPCDLVSELPGLSLLQEWMVTQSGLGGVTGGIDEYTSLPRPLAASGEKLGRRGGLGLFYDTKAEDSIKDEQTDFVATVPFANPAVTPSKTSLRADISQIVYSMPADSLNDRLEDNKGFVVRHTLLRKFPRVSMRTKMRDAHVYIFPFWILEFMQNEHFESVGEDVLGWWARATWQEGLIAKLGLDKILQSPSHTPADLQNPNTVETEANVADYISTRTKSIAQHSAPLASRTHTSIQLHSPAKVPPILAYLQPPNASFIRRVDTTAALLSVSLKLAKLPESSTLPPGTTPSPLSHSWKIAHPDAVPQQTRIESTTCLLAENVTVGAKCNIKEAVIGSGCSIGEGARIIKCVLMDDVIIGENVNLSGCVIGRRCKIEGGPRSSVEKTDLRDCEVEGGYVVTWGTDAKNEKFMLSNLGNVGDIDAENVEAIEPLDDDGISNR